MDIPPVLQPGDREDAIGRILEARHPAGALLGGDSRQGPAPPDALLRYRTLVNQIHPDRCVDQRAERAFIRASLAYDTLCAIDSLPASMTDAARVTWEDAKGEGASQPAGQRWWSVGTVSDLDRCLEFRTEVLKSFWEELAPSLEKEAVARLRRHVAVAERTCEHLDRAKGLQRSRLWPLKVAPEAPAEAQPSALRLVDLLCHLRAIHRFCPLLARGFDHSTELEATSPAAAAGTALRRLLEEKEEGGEGGAVAAPALPAAEDDGVDPLDAYMATLDALLPESTGASEPSSATANGGVDGGGDSIGEQAVESHKRLKVDSCSSKQNGNGIAVTQKIESVNVQSVSVNLSTEQAKPSTPAATPPPKVAAAAATPLPAPATAGLDWRDAPLRPTASGRAVHLTAEAAAAEHRVAQAVEGAAGEKAQEQHGLQNQLLGDLQSDESELEDGGGA